MGNERITQGPGFKIRFRNEHGYLRAHVFGGHDSQQVSIAMWTMIGAECQQLGATRLLVLEELQDIVGEVDVSVISQTMVDVGLKPVRIAFVELTNDITLNEYGEILCLELGIAVRVFSREDAARRWLLFSND